MVKCKNCKHLENKDDGRVRYMWCPLIGDNPDLELERSCLMHKSMTNADRIRKMTDEELAEFLYEIATGNECCICGFKEGWFCKRKENETCHDGVTKLLKSEMGCE